MKFIRRAARLGFTLTEVEQLLTASAKPDVGDVVTGKVAEIEQRMRDLGRVRLALLDVAENGVREQCPVVAALSS